MAGDLLRGAAERANALRAGVILIGGSSTRMGTDKSSLVFADGQTLLDRTIEAISSAVGEILIVGKPVRSASQVNAGPISKGLAAEFDHGNQTAALTIRRVPDRWPGEGPLGGILSAFSATTAMELLVVAVDLPWLSPDSLRTLCSMDMSALGGASADCVMTQRLDHLQPLHARYARRAEVPMAQHFASGQRSVMGCGLRIGRCIASEDDRSSVDVDTPQDWEQALKP